jgi:Tol biopolymer transport system component
MSLKRTIGLLVAAMLVVAAPAAAAQGNGRLAYEAAGSIYMISPDGGTPSLLHTGLLPAFSPDGTRIVFAQTPSDPLGPLTIWFADADGTNARQIGTSPGPRKFSWSPDGTRIAFVSDDGSGFSVVVLKAEGGGSTTVSYDASASGPPSWSPDGTELAFTTTNDADIAVAKADGSGRRLLIQDSTRDVAPSWSPDGSQIAFLREANGALLPLRRLYRRRRRRRRAALDGQLLALCRLRAVVVARRAPDCLPELSGAQRAIRELAAVRDECRRHV